MQYIDKTTVPITIAERLYFAIAETRAANQLVVCLASIGVAQNLEGFSKCRSFSAMVNRLSYAEIWLYIPDFRLKGRLYRRQRGISFDAQQPIEVREKCGLCQSTSLVLNAYNEDTSLVYNRSSR